MNINELSKESHENAVEKGFYNCVECGGDSHPNDEPPCSCNGTGIDQNRNIPELLMLCITEISEAVEALRCGKIITGKGGDYCIKKYDLLIGESSFEWWFERCIHNSFEDEIADVFIRLFDLCGYLEIEIDEIESKNIRGFENNNSENLFNIVSMITELSNTFLIFENQDIELVKEIFNQLLYFCQHNNIDIEKHISAKMQYNKTRPKKHGKEF